MAGEIGIRSAVAASSRRVLLVKSCSNDPAAAKQISHPIGLMSIAAYLRNSYGYEVKIEDIRVSGKGGSKLETLIRHYAPHVVGISALTHESDAVPRIAECVKRVNPGTPVLLGGPHATAYPERAVQLPGIDYAVVGEGELVAGELIDRLMNRGDVSDVRGIVYKKDNQVVSTGRGPSVEDLNALPMPAYDLIPIEAYGKFHRMSRIGSGPFMCIFSSRGCPYRCVYCHNIFGKVFRCRSADNLFREIKYLHETYGIRDFEIMDDIFNLDRDRVIEFCDRVIDSGMKVTFAFPNGIRGDILDREQLVKLRQAGAVFMAFAIETGSPRLQKLIKKNIRLDKIKRNIEIARSLKIHSHGFFMIGFPGETLEEMGMTVDFLISSKLHTFAIFAVMPFENTELAEMARKIGKLPVSDFTMNYHSKEFLNLTQVPSRTVNRIRRQALLKFYLNPSRLFALARDFPNKRELGKLSILFFRRLWWQPE